MSSSTSVPQHAVDDGVLGALLSDLNATQAGIVSPTKRKLDRCNAVVKRLRKYAHRQGDPALLETLDQFSSLLDTNQSIAQAYSEVSTRERACAYFNVPVHALTNVGGRTEPLLQALGEMSKAACAAATTQDVRWGLDRLFATRPGWYPVFTTLTVSDTAHDEVFRRGSRAFHNYTVRVQRAVYKALPEGVRPKSLIDYCVYVAVVERGGKTGRLHIHILWYVRALPEGWDTDPNRFHGDNRRSLDDHAKYWEHGFSTAIAVRTSRDDNWAALGWRWPYERTTDGTLAPLRVTSTDQVTGYMVKYIRKHNNPSTQEDPECPIWRTRLTRGLSSLQVQEKLLRTPWEVRMAVQNPQALQARLRDLCLPSPSSRALTRTALKMMRSTTSAAMVSDLLPIAPMSFLERLELLSDSMGILRSSTRGNDGAWTALLDHFRKLGSDLEAEANTAINYLGKQTSYHQELL